jgi:streptogramin lyase
MFRCKAVGRFLMPALWAAILCLTSLPVGMAQELFVTSAGSNSVLRFSATTGAFVDTFVPAGSGGLSNPRGIALGSDGHLYVSSTRTNSVLRYHGVTGAPLGSFVSSGSGGLTNPSSLAFGPDGNLYVASQADHNGTILKYNGVTGAFIGIFVAHASGGYDGGNGFTFRADGYIYASNIGHSDSALPNKNSILRFDGTTGAFVDVFVPAGSGGLVQPGGVVFGPDGNLFVSNATGDRILRFNGNSGAFIDAFATGGGLNQPFEFKFGPDQNLYTTSLGTNSILRYAGGSGAFLGAFVSPGSGGLSAPWGLVFRGAPNDPPTANAGPDQIVECQGESTPVTLNGSASSDPNGDALSYTWKEGATTLGSGQTLTVALPHGSHAISLTVTDPKGASSSDSVLINVVDTTGPTISITAPAGGTYLLNQAVTATFTASDACSGVASCVGTVASGALINTASVGTKTFSVTATDNGGNVSTKTVTYSVAFGICVLYDQSKAHRSGSTIPIKLQLCDANGVNVSNTNILVHASTVIRASTEAPGPLEDSGNANPDGNFRYDAGLGSTGGYIFNLSTTGYATGTYLLRFTAGGDPTVHTVQFQVK